MSNTITSPKMTFELRTTVDPQMGEGWGVFSLAEGREPRREAYFGSKKDFAEEAVERWNAYVEDGNAISVVAVINADYRRPQWGKLVADDGETLTVRFTEYGWKGRGKNKKWTETKYDVEVPYDVAVIWLPPKTKDEIAIDYDRSDAAVQAERKFHTASGETGPLWPITYID